MKTTLLLILLFASTTANAQCRGSLNDNWFIASNIAFLADYSTTIQIPRSNGEYRESAPLTKSIIGEHPSEGDVQKYFIGRIILNGLIQCYAPKDISKFIQITQTVGHTAAALNNYRIGLKFSF